jgi:hypothetical protein
MKTVFNIIKPNNNNHTINTNIKTTNIIIDSKNNIKTNIKTKTKDINISNDKEK